MNLEYEIQITRSKEIFDIKNKEGKEENYEIDLPKEEKQNEEKKEEYDENKEVTSLFSPFGN